MPEFDVIGGDRPAGFSLCGEQFLFKGISPKAYQEWLDTTTAAENAEQETTWETLCERADGLVLLALHEEDHERYTKLRAGEMNGAPVPTPSEVLALRNWIMGAETGRPPQSGTPSSGGPTETTEASSTDESSELEETPVA